MREAFDTFALVMLCGGLFGLLVIGVAVFAIGAKSVIDEWRKTWTGKGAKVVALLAVVLATLYGGSKTGRVIVDDPYITDAGSYVGTNDFIYVAIAKRYEFVPDETEIQIWRRLTTQSNATDWVMFNRTYTIADYPRTISVPIDPRRHYGSTNYNWMVIANYIPAPTVHTNGVWQIKGFIVPQDGSGRAPSPATYAFPNTKTIRKEDP